METWEVVRFRRAAGKLLRANLKSVAAAAISSPLLDIFGAIAIALLLLLGRDQITHGVFTPGAFVAFIAAVFAFSTPLGKFPFFNIIFRRALARHSNLSSSLNVET